MSDNKLYFKYLRNDNDYFNKDSVAHDEQKYEVDKLPEDCVVSTDDYNTWRFYTFKSQKLKDQGWKIHISTTLDNAQETLNIISEVLVRRQIAFKHLTNKSMLHSINSKNGNRVSSGKFITIYPPTDDVFLELLNVLYKKLKDLENGPYILSDKSWKDSNVYYRYGGFKSVFNEAGEPCIRDEKGGLIPDKRAPYYQSFDFLKEFENKLEAINTDTNEDSDNKLADYKIKKVLRFTNSGGIYLAVRKSNNKKVVIKEARPKVGLDAKNRDSIERLQIERKALTALSDVGGVVNYIDYFKSWKHFFLVEEYIEGVDLQKWIAINYPFYHFNDTDSYFIKVKEIINHLIETVEEMHEQNIGMGDLQPSNIMITKDLKIKLIDFESADNKDVIGKTSMQTIGFSNHQNNTHQERDWFAIKRILRYCLIPIGPISTIDESSIWSQNEWIESEFGDKIFSFMNKVEKQCDCYLTLTKEKASNQNKYFKKSIDISSIIGELKDNLITNLNESKKLIHGDIRQYELPNGFYNVLNGGTGAVLALKRSKAMAEKLNVWIKETLLNEIETINDSGLFTGLAGIATTLYEAGYEAESLYTIEKCMTKIDIGDISLRSGLSGIGLAMISLFLETDNKAYLKQLNVIENYIYEFIEHNKELTIKDWAGVPIGLIDGWSGVSLFFTAMYSITKESHYYNTAVELIERDLKNTKEDNKTLQTYDEKNRLLPYLSGGSIGIGIAIWYLNKVTDKHLFQDELNKIIKLNKIRITFSGGLLEGAGSFLLLPILIEDEKEFQKHINLSMDKLTLFLIKRNNSTLFPGNFCYRLSDDYYSGSAGIILAMESILHANPLYWLPIINPNKFLTETINEKEAINNT